HFDQSWSQRPRDPFGCTDGFSGATALPQDGFTQSHLSEPRPYAARFGRVCSTTPQSGERLMAFVVCEPCRDCKYTDCVVVCPCDCFYHDDSQLYIDPNHCIDCEACASECPVEAIYSERDVPIQWVQYVQLNAERVSGLKGSGGHI